MLKKKGWFKYVKHFISPKKLTFAILFFQGGSNSHNGGINGVTVVNGGPPNLPTADTAEPDNEKWWWVCCLEFCFCLL